MWQDFCGTLKVSTISPLLAQTVNRRVFEQVLLDRCGGATCKSSEKTPAPAAGLLYAEEENTIRYMSGYVALKLMRKYKMEESSEAAEFVECLSGMAVQGPESSFYDYTKQWIKLVDRGGLFHVTDNSFLFFRALELQTRSVLPQHLRSSSRSKDLLIQEMMKTFSFCGLCYLWT